MRIAFLGVETAQLFFREYAESFTIGKIFFFIVERIDVFHFQHGADRAGHATVGGRTLPVARPVHHQQIAFFWVAGR